MILGFALSVAIVVVALSWVLVAIVGSSSDAVAVYGEGAAIHPLNFAQANPELALSAALFWLALIMGASVYKGLELRGGGGGVVARALGGTRVDRSVDDPQLRRLRNVVEEMAIASGVPVPEVYVLDDENGINAFAAGHSPANAAVAVTRGTLQRLTREELQGVIAHEFSHILNGDMQRSRCRKAFSGAGSAYAEVVAGSFKWTQGQDQLTRYASAGGWGLCFCKTCGTTLCGVHEDTVHGVTLGSVDGDPGVQIGMHLFVGSRAPWDHIGGDAPQFEEFPT